MKFTMTMAQLIQRWRGLADAKRALGKLYPEQSKQRAAALCQALAFDQCADELEALRSERFELPPERRPGKGRPMERRLEVFCNRSLKKGEARWGVRDKFTLETIHGYERRKDEAQDVADELEREHQREPAKPARSDT